ncbi:MAG: four helix bundle protein [Verrucomicrobiae bacterium]|nr:four helix bundle protein [Verrucomicrobiae bacterium]MCX7723237.1 four helix bundle protein [Verrucomicrobiae bacterium]MDW7979433.1 four helix bundle protein [Verrucomicrobiales bacterium]
MKEPEMKARTKTFALRAIRLAEALPDKPVARVIATQLVRSATSVASNYRAACHARSKAEFNAKLGIAEEEADEAAFWMEMIIDAGLMPRERVSALLDEAGQLTAILVASRKTSAGLSRHRDNQKSKI